jgi:hypothetical protein
MCGTGYHHRRRQTLFHGPVQQRRTSTEKALLSISIWCKPFPRLAVHRTSQQRTLHRGLFSSSRSGGAVVPGGSRLLPIQIPPHHVEACLHRHETRQLLFGTRYKPARQRLLITGLHGICEARRTLLARRLITGVSGIGGIGASGQDAAAGSTAAGGVTRYRNSVNHTPSPVHCP